MNTSFDIRNLAFGVCPADIGKEHADTFRHVQHTDLRADYVLAKPPFNDSDWFRKDDDVRWQFGVPPKGNANFAWVQHVIYNESSTLTTMCDTPLPKLLSGDLSVAKVEQTQESDAQ